MIRSLAQLLRLALSLILLCYFSASSMAYSVLTHEEIVDLVWKDNIRPLLVKRFPAASADDLKKAHAFAYGGSLIQDMG